MACTASSAKLGRTVERGGGVKVGWVKETAVQLQLCCYIPQAAQAHLPSAVTDGSNRAASAGQPRLAAATMPACAALLASPARAAAAAPAPAPAPAAWLLLARPAAAANC